MDFSNEDLHSPFMGEPSVFFSRCSASAAPRSPIAFTPYFSKTAKSTPATIATTTARRYRAVETEFSRAKHELARANLAQEREQARHSLERSKLGNTILVLSNRTEELEGDRRMLFESEERLKASLKALEQASLQKDVRTDAEMRALRSDKAGLATQLSEAHEQVRRARMEHEKRTGVLESELEQCRGKLLIATQQRSDMQLYSEDYKKRAEAAEAAISNLQTQMRELEATVSRCRDTQSPAIQAIAGGAARKTGDLEALVRKLSQENAHLRELVSNNMILNEKIRSLELRLSTREEHISRLHALEAENERLRQEHSAGLPVNISSTSAADLPQGVFREYITQKLELAAMKEKYGEALAALGVRGTAQSEMEMADRGEGQ